MKKRHLYASMAYYDMGSVANRLLEEGYEVTIHYHFYGELCSPHHHEIIRKENKKEKI